MRNGVSAHVGDGRNRWPAVHQLDAVNVFRLALETGSASARYHAVADEGVPLRDIAELIGRYLEMSVGANSVEEVGGHFGWLALSVSAGNPVSSRRTRELCGWQPKVARIDLRHRPAELF